MVFLSRLQCTSCTMFTMLTMHNVNNVNRVKHLVMIIFCIFSESSLSGNCTNGRITFERTPGLRLPSHGVDQMGPLEILSGTHPTACYSKCIASERCQGYFFDHNDQKCVLISSRTIPISGPPEHSSAWSYHRKICLGGKYLLIYRANYCYYYYYIVSSSVKIVLIQQAPSVFQ